MTTNQYPKWATHIAITANYSPIYRNDVQYCLPSNLHNILHFDDTIFIQSLFVDIPLSQIPSTKCEISSTIFLNTDIANKVTELLNNSWEGLNLRRIKIR